MIDIFGRNSILQGRALTRLGAASDFPFLVLVQARSMSPEQLVKTIERSGLAGKGGAGFLTYRKVELMRRQVSDRKYLVVNGSEHEPGSLKDRYLLENHPETVLEGALIVAHAAGVREVLITIAESATVAMASCSAAIESMAACIGSEGAPVKVKLVPVPDSYMVGEESALL